MQIPVISNEQHIKCKWNQHNKLTVSVHIYVGLRAALLAKQAARFRYTDRTGLVSELEASSQAGSSGE